MVVPLPAQGYENPWLSRVVALRAGCANPLALGLESGYQSPPGFVPRPGAAHPFV